MQNSSSVGFLTDFEMRVGHRLRPSSKPLAVRDTARSASRIAVLDLALPDIRENRLLATLSPEDFALLEPHLVVTAFPRSAVLSETNSELRHVHFPLSGVISLLIEMANGEAVETAFVGKNSVFGASLGFRPMKTPVRAVVMESLVAATITASVFQRIVDGSKSLQNVCVQANDAQTAQIHITSACNTLHKIEQRFCRWLVQLHDVTNGDVVAMTQDFLSDVLGVRRTSVTDVANKLQNAGLINYSRGKIRIVDLAGLEARSCECTHSLRLQRDL